MRSNIDPDFLAWFQYLLLSDENIREKELSLFLYNTDPDQARKFSLNVIAALRQKAADKQALNTIQLMEETVNDAFDHRQLSILIDLLSNVLSLIAQQRYRQGE